MASLVTRKNGVFYAQWKSTERSPRRRRLSLGTTDRALAEALLAELDEAYQRKVWDPWRKTIADYFAKRPGRRAAAVVVRAQIDRALSELVPTSSRVGGKDVSDVPFLAVCKAYLAKKRDEVRPRTYKLYKYSLDRMRRAFGDDIPIAAFETRALDDYIHDTSLAASTRCKNYRVLNNFFAWCVRKHYLKSNPVTRLEVRPKEERSKLPRDVRPDELEKICASMRADYEEKRSRPVSRGRIREGEIIWAIPAFWFALYTGMRLGEIARLRWRHIDFKRKLIYIYEQKSGEESTIPITGKVEEILLSLLKGCPDDFVFKSPQMKTTVRSEDDFGKTLSGLFTRYRRKAGIERRVTFHGTRHGHCTLLAEAGKSPYVIQDSARHSSIKVSMGYVSVAKQHLRKELEDVFGA